MKLDGPGVANVFASGGLFSTPAGRLAFISELASEHPMFDDDGNVVGYSEPLISLEAAAALLSTPFTSAD
jgi:hypothetical protein